ncbi:hypothetical protein VKT23_013943 [Stygiomarasmius scandens]|uniref:Uncharacterized protein n=1 Tax=Marasmiellus scandens TaxID=2682957 RepID=A0ABR1J458_9AGAR
MHTDSTLETLEGTTRALGQQLRHFKSKVCDAFPNTKELDKEEAARGRRLQRKKQNTEAATEPEIRAGKNQKLFNWSTYKFHALGDYVSTIASFGTTDSYTTQTGELEHRRVKMFYARTSKNKAIKQITRLEQRQHNLNAICNRLPAEINNLRPLEGSQIQSSRKRKRGGIQRRNITLFPTTSETLPFTHPDQHYHISRARSSPQNIHVFIHENQDNPAAEASNYMSSVIDQN